MPQGGDTGLSRPAPPLWRAGPWRMVWTLVPSRGPEGEGPASQQPVFTLLAPRLLQRPPVAKPQEKPETPGPPGQGPRRESREVTGADTQPLPKSHSQSRWTVQAGTQAPRLSCPRA